MPLKKIYLVRHGETKYNKLKIVQGRGVDAPLNEVGLSQARMFYQAYKDVLFDKIYISSLKRTHESVQYFIDSRVPYEAEEGLDEISWGDHEGAEASAERNSYLKNTIQEWNKGNTSLKIEGGESPNDVAERQIPVIKKILMAPDEVILICMHGRSMRVLLCQLLNLPLNHMDGFNHNNLGLYILNYSSGKFAVEQTNLTSHLQDMPDTTVLNK